jgi:signal transduction histidine kinase
MDRADVTLGSTDGASMVFMASAKLSAQRDRSGSVLNLALLGLTLLAGLLLVAGSANADWTAEITPPIDVDSGWQYRWGDSPIGTDGTPVWIQDGPDHPAWSAIDFPSNPPGRSGRTNVWYRVPLPDGDWRDPVLYIYSIDLIAEVYLEGERIYHFGTFDEKGRGRFEGWPWHMITLPPDPGGEVLYFRIFSDYYDIGLWGEVKIMDRLSLIGHIVDNSLVRLIAGALSLVIAGLALVFALLQEDRRTPLLIGLFSASAGVMVLTGTQAKQFVMTAPLLWDNLSAAAYFLLPVPMMRLFQDWCRGGGARMVAWIWRLHLVFAVGAIAVSAFGLESLSDLYAIFDALLAVSLLVVFAIAFATFRKVTPDARFAIVAFAVFSLFLLVDMAVARGLLPWTRMSTALGLLAFTMALIVLSLRRVVQTQKALRALTASLEGQVRARTLALERSNSDLQSFAFAVSHDLQAPLRAISGHLGLLKKRCGDQLDDQARAFVGHAINGAHEMSEMIQGMLAYARVESQGATFRKVETDMAVHDAIRDLDIANTCPDAQLEVDPLPPVAGDPIQIRGLFQNLIGNAIKYRHPDRAPHIRVTGALAEGWVTIRVADNGLGIDAHENERAFQMFSRLHGAEISQGCGMGLALCLRIVERHGGRIELDGRRGEGVTITLTLPAFQPVEGCGNRH